MPSDNQRVDADTVLQTLHEFCDVQEPGSVFPSRAEWMKRFNTTERTVRWALDELQRQGRIICRQGARAYVAPKPAGGSAQSLATGVDKHTVIAIAEPDGGLFDQALQVLMKQGKSAKLAVHCRLMSHDDAEHFTVPSVAEGPCGYILFRRQFLSLAQRLQMQGHRVVFVGTPYTDTPLAVPTVSGDQEYGGYLVVKELLELGHRRIAFNFCGDYHTLRRWAGCQRALEEAREEGLEIDSQILEVTYTGPNASPEPQWGNDPKLVSAYFERADAPTAIVSWNDDMAVRLLTLLQRAGLRVPEDVSLIGYDNLTRSADVHPALTTVDGALDTQIQAALRLLSQPEPPSPHRHIVVLPTLISRDSTAPVFSSVS